MGSNAILIMNSWILLYVVVYLFPIAAIDCIMEGCGRDKGSRLSAFQKKMRPGNAVDSSFLYQSRRPLLSMSETSSELRNKIYREHLLVDYVAAHTIELVPGKGKAVCAATDIQPYEFLFEYKGEVLDVVEYRLREPGYRRHGLSFVFEFRVGDILVYLDATDSQINWGPGRYVNHSRRKDNVRPLRVVDARGDQRLIYVAKKMIKKGEEILVDYHDRSPDTLAEFSWLDE